MTRRRAEWAALLVRLYPARWRERYGGEVRELVAERGVSARDGWDLLRGAIDAHLNMADLRGEWSPVISRLRASTVGALAGWVVFCAAACVLIKVTEDPPFTDAARAHPGLAVCLAAVKGAVVVAGLAVLAGGAPLAGFAVRRAWRDRDRQLGVLLAIPVLAVVSVLGYLLVARGLAVPSGTPDTASVGNIALMVGLLALVTLGAASSVLAVRAATYRLELPPSALRWAGRTALVVAGAVSLGTGFGVLYGSLLAVQSPVLFGTPAGLVATPLPVNLLVLLGLGAVAVVTECRAAQRGWSALRGRQA